MPSAATLPDVKSFSNHQLLNRRDFLPAGKMFEKRNEKMKKRIARFRNPKYVSELTLRARVLTIYLR
jgi:hypothetical protein